MTTDSTNTGASIFGASGTDATAGAGSTTSPTARATTLGSDAFLKLLVIKLQNQDPTNPQSDTDFIAQLATFSSLEQLTGIKKAITDLSDALLDPATSTAANAARQTSTQKGIS